MTGNIIMVNGVALPAPSKFQWSEADVSAAGSGRVEDGTMYKNKIGACVNIELAWDGVTTAQAKTILTAFADEYFSVTYIDPRRGSAPNYTVTSTFYVGDRTAPMYSYALDRWENISFKIVERGVH